MDKDNTKFVEFWNNRLIEREIEVGKILRVLTMAIDLGTDKILSKEELLMVARVLYCGDIRYVDRKNK